jgi:hypothetical protein
MKTLQVLLMLSILSNSTFGQKIFRADNAAYKSNKFVYEFYLFNDSSCFLKGQYLDSSGFFLYKGILKRTTDTLYEFKCQGIVSFGGNMRIPVDDSVCFYFDGIDTTMSSLTYKIKTRNGIEQSIELKGKMTMVFIKGSARQIFLVDTKFIDPLTNKKVYLTVDIHDAPYFDYYGTKTKVHPIKISIIKNKLTIFPDYECIQDQDTFILIK